MGGDYQLPKSTDFSIMVPDIRKAIMNYDEIETKVTAMGMTDFL